MFSASVSDTNARGIGLQCYAETRITFRELAFDVFSFVCAHGLFLLWFSFSRSQISLVLFA